MSWRVWNGLILLVELEGTRETEDRRGCDMLQKKMLRPELAANWMNRRDELVLKVLQRSGVVLLYDGLRRYFCLLQLETLTRTSS